MSYNTIRNKIGKFYSGGELPSMEALMTAGYDRVTAAKARSQLRQYYSSIETDPTKKDNYVAPGSVGIDGVGLSEADRLAVNGIADKLNPDTNASYGAGPAEVGSSGLSDMMGGSSGSMNWAGGVAAAAEAADNLFMGDKNFGSQSLAIDTVVHGTSKALISSGNPYAAIAGVALEGANFLIKAGGLTVLGFDVDINSSGYGQMGHMESKSSRDFGAMIGLGGLNRGRMLRQLEKRNQQAMMAMTAADIANDLKFEQEARMNSVLNTIMNNQIALAGGIGLESLGA